MSSNLFDQKSKNFHEERGNNVEAWLLNADTLYRAGNIIYNDIGDPPAETLDADLNIINVWKWFTVHDVGRMLRGMAIECLIKAAWLKKGKRLVQNGKFIGIPNAKDHDLYGMYVVVFDNHKMMLSLDEKKLLARLSYAIVSARYPISKSYKGNYPSAPAHRHKMYWNKCSHHEDSELFESLWKKIVNFFKVK